MSCSIEVRNLAYEIDGKVLFKNVSFKLGHKDKIAIIGPNGAGKTTLLKIVAGLKRCKEGEIYLFDQKIKNLEDFEVHRRRIGYLFQDPEDQLIYPIVLEDIAFGLINKGVPIEEAKLKALEMLKKLQIEHLKDKITFKMSGGEKKLVALAGILIMEPDILLLDEPSTGLDEFYIKKISEILKSIEKTMLIVSHDYSFVKDIVDDFYRLTPKGLTHTLL